MRIISGKYKGLLFETVNCRDVRPTTDRVREAMFSTLFSIYGSIENVIILDAFCGSGALSFESLSRGALCSYMFEKNYNTYKVIKKNMKSLNISKFCKLFHKDIFLFDFNYLKNNVKFDIVFLDPPYKLNYEKVLFLLDCLISKKLMSNDAVIVYEHGLDNDSFLFAEKLLNLGLKLHTTKKYSSSKCDFFKFNL